MVIPEKVDGYIKHFARRYCKLPDATVSYEDLIQEGRLVVLKCLNEYDQSAGCSLETFCYSCLHNWFVDRGRRIRYAHGVMQTADFDAVVTSSHSEHGTASPERCMMIAQALSCLQSICGPIAEIILDDIGDELYLILKDDLKQKSIRNKWSVVSSKVRLTKKLIRECFGLTKKDLREIAQILKLYV